MSTATSVSATPEYMEKVKIKVDDPEQRVLYLFEQALCWRRNILLTMLACLSFYVYNHLASEEQPMSIVSHAYALELTLKVSLKFFRNGSIV